MKSWARLSLIRFLGLIVLVKSLSFGLYPLQNNNMFTVDRLTDANPQDGGEGSAQTGDLRYAFSHAQSGDTVTFNVSGVIQLTNSLPPLDQDIRVEGMAGLTIHGEGNGSVLIVGSDAHIFLSNLTITGGVGNGGGILNKGSLTLDSVRISGNRAGDPTNGGGTGAGIWNYLNASLALNNSTVSDNTALGNSSYNPSRGGGIANYGTLILNNSTVSGNSVSEGSGGGISNTLPASILTLNNSTVSSNSVTGVLRNGGGIENLGTLKSSNTILAGNLENDLHGVLVSTGHNLIGNTAGGSGFRSDLGDLLNLDPLLAALEDNGGPTWTHALLFGSPAIDAGDDTTCLSSDQRGIPRPQDGNLDGTTTCDIGAYELGGVPPTVTATLVLMETRTPTLTPAPFFTETPTVSVTYVVPSPTHSSSSGPSPLPCTGAALLTVLSVLVGRRSR